MSFSIFSARGANSASPNLLAGFDGSFRDGGKTGEGKKLHEGKQERKEIYGYDRRKTPPPPKKNVCSYAFSLSTLFKPLTANQSVAV